MDFAIVSLLTLLSVGIAILVLLPVVAASTPKGSPSYVLAVLAAFLLCYAQLPFLPSDPNDMSWDSMGIPSARSSSSPACPPRRCSSLPRSGPSGPASSASSRSFWSFLRPSCFCDSSGAMEPFPS